MAGLKNEQWIRARYEEVCRNNPEEYALISMKIKRFRIFNRMFGWEAGDELITMIYDCVESWLKPEEYIAHIRSGYYLLLVHMPEDYDDIFHYIIEINSRIRDWPYDEKYGKIYMGFGIFRLEHNPPDFLTAQYNADICRTESAESGLRNSHFEVYGLTYRDANLRNYNMEQDFRPAIEREDFKLYLQPKVDLRTGEITEAEALVRWIDPEKGMIPVSEFLPELEKNGLIGDLDLYMFQHVCSTINRWLLIYGRKIRISVNLSSNMFNYRYFLDEYKRVYEKVPCPKDCIEFELLESIVLNQLDLVQDVVEQLRDYGFSCSLDDFGSGYSSFSVLTSTELKTLKIDRSLFRNYSDPRERVLVRHIVETAKELDLKIVAEGIETREYVDFLKGLGCDYIQGFIFYKPMPVGEKLLIRPLWEEECEAGDRTVLNLEPGLAFGTGTHETTRLCLELLEKYVEPGCDFLDMGCGSGILSVAALLLGAKSAVGVDIDPLAVKTAVENAETNEVGDRFTGICGNLAEKVHGKFHVIAANIVADIVILLSKDAPKFLYGDSVYIVSGIIDTREADVLEALRDRFEVMERKEEKGWVAMALKQKVK